VDGEGDGAADGAGELERGGGSLRIPLILDATCGGKPRPARGGNAAKRSGAPPSGRRERLGSIAVASATAPPGFSWRGSLAAAFASLEAISGGSARAELERASGRLGGGRGGASAGASVARVGAAAAAAAATAAPGKASSRWRFTEPNPSGA
jgi:hypothetical protein